MISPSLRSLPLNARFSHFLSPNHNRILSKASLHLHKTWKHSMSLSEMPAINDGILRINGKNALTCVPDNVIVTPWENASAFVGATSTHKSCRHVFKLGVIQDVRLLCLFRFKIWWMIPRMGTSGSDVPIETQMLLMEAKEEETIAASDRSTSYILFLPVLDGEFRSSLQGNSAKELELCVESGDPTIIASQSLKAVFVNSGDNPFDLMKESMKMLEKHKGTFSLRESKKMPGMLDWFGWCTWDAFYTEVNPQGIKDGLKSLSEGGTPARFLIIDDGWQDTTNEFQKDGEPFPEGSQFGARLVSIKENTKFRKNEAATDLKDFVSEIKKEFGLKYVYVWHALMGYWGGVHPDAPGTKKYKSKLRYPVQSPGNLANMRDISMDCMEKYGVGTIDPDKIFEFYDDLHRYLVSQDVDGVKVDVQNILETIATDLGGRVSLTQKFQQALEKSIAANFKDNSIICCMAQSTDSIYNSKKSSITRASDDYWPKNQASQTLHIAAVAFNSIFLGEIVVPDWDMFYSRHYAAEFHAVARAVGGCGVYVSDKPGHHDFEILKRLVLPDGSVLRAKYPGRPSRDCLFNDPVTDGKSLLKIWNLNKFSGILGIFNCQGAGIWPCLDKNVQNSSDPELSGHVSPADIEYFEEICGDTWTGDCAVFSFNSGSLSRLPKKGFLDVSLKVLQCDVFTISPIKLYDQRVQFAPIGLTEMYNSGGAIEEMEFFSDSSQCGINIKGRGPGRFGAYCSVRPKFCTMNGKKEEFQFKSEDNFLTITVPSGINCWDMAIYF
ncbi:PREDICTED: probable galactinol--sucrose galactosyltransferase 2 [Nelumbo nucifera]|uniref:galactinol--sucrose galactosyltransferase n=2 Tax=Nelumbo nucifera TaxID=4432 RepID=A0A822XWC7_NELNU|nr:PREDICTED: probable galactinol--sucrose galactosyltransferase 2 [Nelumbo nucifera]DAD24312.1 TPA_asm: hypothetical protein HUJ06_025776 [Nelumbo nucifera]